MTEEHLSPPQVDAGLWIVATPIGNLDDITLRALKVLEAADLILAEDTRRTKVLLQRHGISGPLRAYHAHSKDTARDAAIALLEQGQTLALVSDAGTPIVSDPGAGLVAAARDAGLPVHVAPGASAPLAALCLSGLRADRFRFLGFVPRSGKRRRQFLDAVAQGDEAQVLFEAPRRVADLLRDLSPLLQERRVAVARELTKVHEELVRGTAAELAERFEEDARGEFTLVVEGRDPQQDSPQDDATVDAWIADRLQEGERPKEIARALSAWSGIKGREAYARVLAARRSSPAT